MGKRWRIDQGIVHNNLHQFTCFSARLLFSNIDSHIQYSRPLLGKVKTFTIVESEVAPRNDQCSVTALVFLRALVRTLVMGVTTIPFAVSPVIFSLLLRTSSMFVALVFLRALGLVPVSPLLLPPGSTAPAPAALPSLSCFFVA